MLAAPDSGCGGRRLSTVSGTSHAHMYKGSRSPQSHEPTVRELAEQMVRAHNAEVVMLRQQIDELSAQMVRRLGPRTSTMEETTDFSPTISCAARKPISGGRGTPTIPHIRDRLDPPDAGVVRLPQDGCDESPAPSVAACSDICSDMEPRGVPACAGAGAASSREGVHFADNAEHPEELGDVLDVVFERPRRRISHDSRRVSSNDSRGASHRGSRASRSSNSSAGSSLRSLRMPRSFIKDLSPTEKWCLLVDRLLRDPWKEHSRRQQDGDTVWELLPLWIRTSPWMVPRDRAHSSRSPSRILAALPTCPEKSLRVGEVFVEETSCLQDFVIMPNRLKHVSWIVIGAFFILFDAITIPTIFFENKAYEMFLLYFSFGTALYWVLDMVMHCFVGVHHADGWIEMRPQRIRAYYLRTTFGRDLVIILIDATAITIQTVYSETHLVLSTQGQKWRINRALPFLRLVRLLRMGRVRSVVGMLLLRIQTDYLLLMNVCELILVLLMLNHYIACLWYGLASVNPGSEQHTWIDEYTIPEDAHLKVYHYFLAYHWSLTQFSPATNNIAPQNLQERIFAAMVVTFALIVFSSFLGQLNGTMTQVRLASGKKAKEESRIRDYIDTHKISTNLSTRIRNFFKQNYQQGRALLHEEDIEFFRHMPESLKISLHYEIYMPCMRAGSVLYWFDPDDPHLLPELCHKAMSEISFFPGQDVFIEQAPAECAYTVSSGSLIYEDMNEQSRRIDPGTSAQMVWVAELVLFTPWKHVGNLSAGVTSEVVTLDAGVTHQILLRGTPAFEKMRNFAIFVIGQCETQVGEGYEVNDLPLDMDVQEDMYSRVSKLDELRNSEVFGRVSHQFESMSNRSPSRVSSRAASNTAFTPSASDKVRRALSSVRPAWSSFASKISI